jgi:hypothetical protein
LEKRGLGAAKQAYCFTKEQREDLKGLGLIDGEISELEDALPNCAVVIQDDPRLADTRHELDALVGALKCLKRIFDPPAKATREALNRWQREAHALGHLFGRTPEFANNLDIPGLLKAARSARESLVGAKQRRLHTANPKPIRRIDEALMRGRMYVNEALKSGALTEDKVCAYPMDRAAFRKIVCIAYEAMGFGRDYEPDRALREFYKRRTLDATKWATERDAI